MDKKDADQIKQTAGPYSKEALEGRQKFLELRLRQDPEIIRIMTRAADRVATQIKRGGASPLREKQLATIEAQLRREAETIQKELTGKLETYIEKGVDAGGWQSRAVAIKLFRAAKFPHVTIAGLNRMYVRVNRQAVAAIWNRTKNGMMLSYRIWKTGQNAQSAIQNIIQSAVASGQNAVTTAKALEQYVKKGAGTLARHYPAMMEHMQGRVPKNLSYEALRLARTEMTAALGQGQIRAAQATPGVKGIKYCLSSAHRIVDICDGLARNNEAGLGPGVYAVDDPPPYPAHPNTMSYLVTVYEKPEDFAKRLKEWEKEPNSQPELEKWYQSQYKSANEYIRNAPNAQKLLTSKLTTGDYKIIDNDLRRLPARHLAFLEQNGVEFVQSQGGSSAYDPKTKEIWLLPGMEKGEINHEIGHAVEHLLALGKNPEYLKCIAQFKKASKDDIIRLPDEKRYVLLSRSKYQQFITNYQAKFDLARYIIDEEINSTILPEYFAEGYRTYYSGRHLRLARRDPLLYEFIKELKLE